MRNAMKNVFTQTTDQPAPVGIATTKSKKPNNSKQKEILVCLWRGRSGGRCTLAWLPNFLEWVVYHIFLPMVLRFARESSAKKNTLNFWIMKNGQARNTIFSIYARQYLRIRSTKKIATAFKKCLRRRQQQFNKMNNICQYQQKEHPRAPYLPHLFPAQHPGILYLHWHLTTSKWSPTQRLERWRHFAFEVFCKNN